MTRVLLAATTAMVAVFSAASPTLACSPTVRVDPVTGEQASSNVTEGLRAQQQEWRERSEAVLLVQVQSGRLIPGREVEFTLAPYLALYGGDLPERDPRLRWHPGNTCNRFPISIADTLVVYLGPDHQVIGTIRPQDLQDRPPEFGRRLREIARGLLQPRAGA